MMEKSENSNKNTDITAKYAVMLERYGHLADYNAEMEVQFMRERADRENIIKKEVEAQVAAEKRRVEDELAVAKSKIREEYASKDAELAAKQRNIEECERKLFENLQRREQEISLKIQAEVDQKLDAIRHDAQHKLMTMIQDFLSAIKSLQSGDTVRMKEYLDRYVQKAEDTEKAYTSEITKVLDSSVHKQQKKNQQCEKLVRMLFLRTSEKWNPGEEEKATIAERILGNVKLSEEEKADYVNCVAQLKVYRQRNALRENPTLSAEGMIRQEQLSGQSKVSYRQRYAAPAWRVLQLWCMKHILEVPDDTLIYKAMNYVLRHYAELTGYLDIAEMPIDNNDTERSIRDMVMGKKAYLFCQNDLSCSHAAEMYSFFGACKVLGKNPEHWLTYALKHINTWPKDRLEELLPENWTEDTI